MKNPLRKRYIRELKSNFGRYMVIFLFLSLFISLVSGFLITDNNFKKAYDESFEKYNIEDGHVTFNIQPDETFLKNISEKGGLKFYNLEYFEETVSENGANLRVYKNREQVNLISLLSGKLPANPDEIVLDRLYADNNEIGLNDIITINGKKLKVSGLAAFSDYSSLFENNTDMMFDSFNFGIAVMDADGFNAVGSTNIFYNYAWKYNHKPENDVQASDMSSDLLKVLEEEIKAYDTELFRNFIIDEKYILEVTGYVPEYLNKAIHFSGDDMGKDAGMFKVFSYIVICIIAFVFAVTVSNTIAQEAGVIGTLRASGFSRGEMVSHYMTLPVLVTVLGAAVGNILGYTVMKDYFVKLYYNSYSLPEYVNVFNADAFINTTVVPVILMFVINFFVLAGKMRLTPLMFLRRQLSKNRKKKAIKLNGRISFINRFRLRILIQNIPAYITLFVGILLGALVIIFGTMFGPLLRDYSELVKESKLASYQYILKNRAETSSADAEKYCVESLDYTGEGYMTDELTVYGIAQESRYVLQNIPSGRVLISNGVADKFGMKEGDTISLKDHYSDKFYDFTVGGVYKYDAAMAIFMNRDMFNESFNRAQDYFSGYFTNTELTDINADDIATVITEKDLTKFADQLLSSIGDMVSLFTYFGVIMFLLLMYLLTKQIIEKNMVSISMTKILGFSSREIGGLYLVMTSAVVLISLLLSIPIADAALRWIFGSLLYKMITGYIPYIVSNSCYCIMLALGVISYILVSVFMMVKINKIPKGEALRNVEL